MKILITGGCGFVGTNIAIFLKSKKHNIYTLDNLSRKGSKYNLNILKSKNITNYKLNVSNFKKVRQLPKFDLIIDCCAEAAVEISRKNIDRVIDTNFIGTLSILKKAKQDKANIIFLSSSRVYPIKEINKIVNKKILKKNLKITKMINEQTRIIGPKTIYGVTKLSSEMLIEEFSYIFKLKYIINRCGVISGPLQFGKQDQGFVSLWIWRHLMNKNLSYIGYGGWGKQIRDVLHIDDLCKLINLQIKNLKSINNILFTVGGSKKSNTSLENLTKICEKITENKIKIKRTPKTSIYDIPYFVTDNKKVAKTYKWKPQKNIFDIVNDTYNWLSKNKSNLLKYF